MVRVSLRISPKLMYILIPLVLVGAYMGFMPTSYTTTHVGGDIGDFPAGETEYKPTCQQCHDPHSGKLYVKSSTGHVSINVSDSTTWVVDSVTYSTLSEVASLVCERCHVSGAEYTIPGDTGAIQLKGPHKSKTCLDCHDPHAPNLFPLTTDPLGQMGAGTDQVITKMGTYYAGVDALDTNNPSTSYLSLNQYDMCGKCHTNTEKVWGKSAHK